MFTNIHNQRGVTLIELIVFIVVIGIMVVSLSAVFRQAMISLEQPIRDNKMLDLAHSQLNAILSRRFDENTPIDGTPCDISIPCAGIGLDVGESLSNTDFLDDVDDFNGYSDIPELGYTRSVNVMSSGVLLGLQASHAKRIDVTVTNIDGDSLVVTAYKVNQ